MHSSRQWLKMVLFVLAVLLIGYGIGARQRPAIASSCAAQAPTLLRSIPSDVDPFTILAGSMLGSPGLIGVLGSRGGPEAAASAPVYESTYSIEVSSEEFTLDLPADPKAAFDFQIESTLTEIPVRRP